MSYILAPACRRKPELRVSGRPIWKLSREILGPVLLGALASSLLPSKVWEEMRELGAAIPKKYTMLITSVAMLAFNLSVFVARKGEVTCPFRFTLIVGVDLFLCKLPHAIVEKLPSLI